MSTVVLFHSALGLRPAVHRFADALRADGHTVHTPDLFERKVFERLEDGMAERDTIGIPVLTSRAAEAVANLSADVIYAGFSMGAASAQWLGATRTGARGVVLMHAVLPMQSLGMETWPEVPVQVHYAAGDPWVDPDVATTFANRGDVFVYDGGGHLFADEDSPDFHQANAASMLERVRIFANTP
ncbi:MAG: dienelactone hydrolase family protein [Myxococcota bacterium]